MRQFRLTLILPPSSLMEEDMQETKQILATEPGSTFLRYEEPRLRADEAARRESVDVVVIGGGQAGLATSYHLKRRGIDHVVLEAAPTVGDSWRRRWDSLTLFTPCRFTSLDGMRFPKPATAFATKDEMADYLEAYAARFQLPVRTGIRVRSLSAERGRYLLDVGGSRIVARQVVIAAASMQAPKRPVFAGELDPSIRQLDARDYRNPEQIGPGRVLVVGAGNSGAEISSDLAATHEVVLAGNSPGELPVPYDSWRATRVLMPFLFRIVFHRLLSMATPMGRKAQPKFISHSHPLIRVRRKHLDAAGVRLLPKMAGVSGGKPRFEDGSVQDPTTIIWCTGYTPGLDWVKLDVLTDNGRLKQHRGTVEGQPGLHVVGMHFQRAASSVMIHGVSTDARIVAAEVSRRLAAPASTKN